MKQAIHKTTAYLETSFILWRLFVVVGWQSRNSTSYEKCWCSHNAATCLSTFELCLNKGPQGGTKTVLMVMGKDVPFFPGEIISVINTWLLEALLFYSKKLERTAF